MHKTPLAAAAAALLAHSALAAESDHLNLQEPERPAYLKPAPGAPFTLPTVPPEPEAIAPDLPGGLLERVRFVGNTVIGSEDLQAVAAPFLGKAASPADIETLRQKLTLVYVERGFINSGAVFAADAWDRGTLTVNLVEGRLKEIRLRGLERLDEHYVADRLARSDEPLNVLTLGERFQMLLTDPLFARMNGQLLPDVERGKAILNVDIERALPYQLTLAANNYRPVSIGADTLGLSGWVRNLTGYGDVVEASYQGPLDDGKARRNALGWRLPVNTRGTQISLNYEDGNSAVIEQPIQPLNIQSKLVSKDIGISQSLVETLRQRFALGLNRVLRENRTTLLGLPFSFVAGEPSGISKARDWRFWQEYSQRWEDQVLALRSTFTFGENNQEDPGATPGRTPERHYHVWLGQAQYARRLLDNGTQLILRLNVQDTGQRLIAMEGMSLGGVNTVRGYRENQLVRDNGVVTNIELDFPVLADGAQKFSLNLAPFYDHGRARNNGEGPATLNSIGVAARLRWQGLAVDLAVAQRENYSATVVAKGRTLQDRGIHLQVSYNFF